MIKYGVRFHFISDSQNTRYGVYIDDVEIYKAVPTDLSELSQNLIPKEYGLSQNYPNPFNPSTNISFSLPSRSFVLLKVFDVLGREITTIVSEELSAGNYSRQWNASNLPSGVYFYRLQAGEFVQTKKLMILK